MHRLYGTPNPNPNPNPNPDPDPDPNPVPTLTLTRRVLIGGSLGELERLTGWAGRKVLYVGDHLHADLREPRRGYR